MKTFFRSSPIVSGKSGLCGQGCLGGGEGGSALLVLKHLFAGGPGGALKIGQVLLNV